jgi:hypothetical protein
MVSRENSADGTSSVYAVDIDGDGDMDVLSASWYDDKIAWYENLLIISAEQQITRSWLSNSIG